MFTIPKAMFESIDRAVAVYGDAVRNGFGPVAIQIASGVHVAYANAHTHGLSMAVTSMKPPVNELAIKPVDLACITSNSRGFHALS